MKRYEFLRTPLLDFVPRVSPTFTVPRHLAPLARLIERAEREPVRALVSCPPRHGKTETLLHGAAWYLARNPSRAVGYATYSAKLANSKSRAARDYAGRAGLKLRDDAAALHEWRTHLGGGMLAAGVGGTWTGHGVQLLIIDDPIANREEAESQLVRDGTFDWLTSTALTRVEPGGSVIVNMARWHEDDMIGRLRREQPGRWEVVNLPALDENGAPLWAERWPADALDEKRAEIGEYDFASLYLGSPRPRGGQLFGEPVRYSQPEIHGRRIVISCDPAASASTRSDYSVATVLAFGGAGKDLRADVLEVVRRQLEIPALVAELARLQRKWTAPIVVEAVGVGKAVPQLLRQVATGKSLRLVEVQPKGDKWQRAQPVALAWNEGRIRVPTDAPWLRDWLTEILNFTGVGDRHDDCVDSLSLAWNHVVATAVRPVSLERGAFAHQNQTHVPTDAWGRPIRS